jgi:type IV pilus assembly protein PilC
MSEDAITDMLDYAGYRLINLKPYIPFLSLEKLKTFLSPVKPTDIILFYRQLALLLDSGVNIVTALGLLQEQISNHTLKKTVSEVVEDLRGGDQLSVAMGRHPGVFSQLSCRTLSIGEQTGALEDMLRQVADYMEKELTTRKGIKSALMYPVIAAIVTVVVVGVLMFFVLPAFNDLYGSIGAELPAITKLLMDLSVLLRNHALAILLLALIIVGSGMLYFRSVSGKYRLDAIMMRLPMIGRVRHLNELSRCCRSIALLFTAGLPLTEIMPMVIQGSNNRVMAQALNEVQTDMLKGEGLSKPMSRNPIFLPMMVQMVKVGEETGSLDTSLQAVASNYETEATDKTKSLIGLIQPVMTVAIAGIVGLIALSMVSAMYSMYGQTF